MASAEENSLGRRRRTTYSQLETLWEFLNSHRELVSGYNKSSQAREFSRRLWKIVADPLNSQEEGAIKDWKGWSSYWVDYKAKLKRKATAVRASENRTGGGPRDVVPLTDLEKKFLGLLGDGFGIGLTNIKVDPFPTLSPIDSGSDATNVLEEQLLTEEVVHEEPADPLANNPLETSPVPAEPEPEPERRRRRRHGRGRRENHISQEAARRTLVEHSSQRLQLEIRNAQTWEQILNTLQRIANTFDRVAGGL